MKQRDIKKEGDRERHRDTGRQTNIQTERYTYKKKERYVFRQSKKGRNIPSQRKFAGRKYAFFVKVRIWRERGVINDSPYPR